jgi:hypothetical protein
MNYDTERWCMMNELMTIDDKEMIARRAAIDERRRQNAARPPEYWQEIMNDTEWAEYKESVVAGFVSCRELLRGFLDYLDAMPVKRLVAGCFMEPKTGDLCTVAAFCAYRGFGRREMILTERTSRRQRRAKSFWEATSPSAGEEAGLTFDLACNLIFLNDERYGYLTREERWKSMRLFLGAMVSQATPCPGSYHDKPRSRTTGTRITIIKKRAGTSEKRIAMIKTRAD